jgi:hypothetical protein
VQFAGAGVEGGPGGQNVVDEQHVPPGNPGARPNLEGSVEVLEPFLAAKLSLGSGPADSAEGFLEGDLAQFLELECEEFGLIEPAPPLFPPVQGDRHQEIGPGTAQALIGKVFRQPMGKGQGKERLAAVFELVQEGADHVGGPMGGECEGKGGIPLGAVGAPGRQRRRSRKRPGTLQAEGREFRVLAAGTRLERMENR